MRRFAALCLVVAACTSGSAEPATTSVSDATTTTPTSVPARWDLPKPFVGFSLSPAAYDEQGFNTFLQTAPEMGSLVAWVGAWQEIDQGGGLVVGLADEHGYVPVIVTGFPTEDGRRVLPDSDQAMIEAISSFVDDNPVPYLGVGVEINAFLWEKSPGDFDRFAELFASLVDAVHDVSPETKVFPGFQLERLRGLKGGLFGEEPTDPDWELIDRFPSADAIGFTTYPGLVFTDPAEIPEDYYAAILDHVDKPIVFTEVGWQAGGELGDWSGTPEKQAAYVATWLPELSEIADMVIWSFLWDQEAAPPAFDTMGLITADGTERPAFGAWRGRFGG